MESNKETQKEFGTDFMKLLELYDDGVEDDNMDIISFSKMIQSGEISNQADNIEEIKEEYENYTPTGQFQRFFRADKQKQKNALGNILQCDPKTKAALSNINLYWRDVDLPREDDWLHTYPKDGFGTFDKFGGKIVSN